jgi:hypothetical protein
MSEVQIAHVALLISVVSLGGQLWNAWLKLRIRADIAELIERLDKRYPSRAEFAAEVRRLDERVAAVTRQY